MPKLFGEIRFLPDLNNNNNNNNNNNRFLRDFHTYIIIFSIYWTSIVEIQKGSYACLPLIAIS